MISVMTLLLTAKFSLEAKSQNIKAHHIVGDVHNQPVFKRRMKHFKRLYKAQKAIPVLSDCCDELRIFIKEN